MQRLLREPLVHFLVLGAALFLVFNLTGETDQAGERRIVVTPGQVEQLAAQFSRTWLRPPTPSELDGLIERYVRREIYYREALAMGLGQDDPYVRNRLALKLEVLLDDLSAEAEPADTELADFLESHAERFAKPARLSFRQVYLNPERHPDPTAEARRLLETLRDGGDPNARGDVSMLIPGLAAASPDEIARHFGEDFAEALVVLEPGGWDGPVRSPYGIHLVLVTQCEPERQPALAEIRDRVLVEWRDQRRHETKEQAYQRLRERYEIVMQQDSAAPAPDTAAAQQAAQVQAGQ
ncbi:peptidyl-prolyl cis-trans isomerase [Lamprobacter modestohalophilus]|nr:peptidylprolyl isomerase [Lamprobacter modestohalophilus]